MGKTCCETGVISWTEPNEVVNQKGLLNRERESSGENSHQEATGRRSPNENRELSPSIQSLRRLRETRISLAPSASNGIDGITKAISFTHHSIVGGATKLVRVL